jgi:hypothetical protein
MCTSSNKEAALTTAYQEVCNSYHAIDDVRMRLIGLLPLISGAGIVILLRPEVLGLPAKYYPPIGLFGFVVTLGLLLFEVRGVQQCYFLIALGKEIEKSLCITEAQFTRRPKELVGLGKTSSARVIYPAVLAAWTFITLFKLNVNGAFKLNFNWAALIALCLGVVGFIFSFVLTRYFERKYLEHNGELRFRE